MCLKSNSEGETGSKTGISQGGRRDGVEPLGAHFVAVATRVETPDEAHSQRSTEEGEQDAQAAHVLQGHALTDQHIP